MKDHRVSCLLAFAAVLTATAPMLGQAPSPPMTEESGTPGSAQESRIRRRVLFVNVPVTVMNAEGELVSNLDAKDFLVTDNGVQQKITYLDLGLTPLSIVILVETSSRIEPLLSDMRKTGILFADALMGPDDEAAVAGFNNSVDDLADFTTNHNVILDAINNLKCGTERSKLFDAMATGVNILSGRLQQQSSADSQERRPVIVVMSEATDVGSDGRLDAVLRRAQLYNIAIYSVGIPTTLAELKASPRDVRHQITPEGIFALPGMPGTVQIQPTEDIRNGYGNLMNFNLWALKNVKDQITGHALQIAAAKTGGRHIATFGPTTMQKAVDEIAAELHAQYSLRARPGYYIAPPES